MRHIWPHPQSDLINDTNFCNWFKARFADSSNLQTSWLFLPALWVQVICIHWRWVEERTNFTVRKGELPICIILITFVQKFILSHLFIQLFISVWHMSIYFGLSFKTLLFILWLKSSSVGFISVLNQLLYIAHPHPFILFPYFIHVCPFVPVISPRVGNCIWDQYWATLFTDVIFASQRPSHRKAG